ncbi:hypothetical protein DFH28DRAFT_829979, partial [Melampsora americana]
RSLTKILLARHPYLKHKLLEGGKCIGPGVPSVTVTLIPRDQVYDPTNIFSPQHELTVQSWIFFAQGL